MAYSRRFDVREPHPLCCSYSCACSCSSHRQWLPSSSSSPADAARVSRGARAAIQRRHGEENHSTSASQTNMVHGQCAKHAWHDNCTRTKRRIFRRSRSSFLACVCSLSAYPPTSRASKWRAGMCSTFAHKPSSNSTRSGQTESERATAHSPARASIDSHPFVVCACVLLSLVASFESESCKTYLERLWYDRLAAECSVGSIVLNSFSRSVFSVFRFVGSVALLSRPRADQGGFALEVQVCRFDGRR